MSLVEWYLARASGVVAFVLLTVAVVLGLTLSGRAKLRYWPRFAVEDVHRFAGLLTGAFVSLHVLALFADSYMPFSLPQLVVPGASTYRPLATALGVVAAELLFALAITNRYRKRLSYRFWRRAHYVNFAVWGLALAHGLAAGSDRAAWPSRSTSAPRRALPASLRGA
jgi:methionine sulfoxide reductase heme-binding subunit